MTAHWKKEMRHKLELGLNRSDPSDADEMDEWFQTHPSGDLFIYGVPYVAMGFMALFIFVYWAEHVPGSSVTFGKTLPPLYAAGAVSRDIVLAGEWWRVFTAPLLHTGFEGIVSSVLYTFIAGSLSETFIGRAWFAGLFVVSAIGGSIGCLVLDPHSDFTAGAGAAAGLIAGTCAYFLARSAVQSRKRSHRGTLWLVIPALIPIALPILHGTSLHLSIGALVGGSLAGGIMGFVLCELCPDRKFRPGRTDVALAIVAVGAILSVVSFWIII